MQVATHHPEPPWASTYLTALEATGLPHTAAQTAGTTLELVSQYAQQSREFAYACEQAEQLFNDSLEAEAIRRAKDGTLKGVYYKGERIDDEKVYSDSLMSQLLKGRRSQTYGDKKEVNFGGNVQVVLAPVAQLNASTNPPPTLPDPSTPPPAALHAPLDSTCTVINTAITSELEDLL